MYSKKNHIYKGFHSYMKNHVLLHNDIQAPLFIPDLEQYRLDRKILKSHILPESKRIHIRNNQFGLKNYVSLHYNIWGI